MSDPTNEHTNGRSTGDLDDPQQPGAPTDRPSQAEGDRDQSDLPPRAEPSGA
jgi:hypothetical protein